MRKIVLVMLLATASVAFAQVPQNRVLTTGEYESIIKHYRYLKPDSAVFFAQKAIDFARLKGDSVGVATILLQQGMIDDNNGKFENAEKKYTQALELFKRGKVSKGMASSMIRLGVVHLRNGKYDNAIGDFLTALKTSEAARDTFGLMEANYNISWAYLDQNKHGLALQYLLIAEKYNQQIPFSNISLNIYNHFGVIYTHEREYKKAKYYLEKGLQLSQQPEYQGLYINILNNLAGVYTKEGFPDKAIALQKEALARSRNIGNYLRELQSLVALSKSYTAKDPNQAIFYLKEAVLLARAKDVPKQEIRYLQNITDLYKSVGNYKEALAMKERQYILADSFFYKKVSQNIEALKAEYELSKSTARVKELNFINNERELEIKNAHLLRNITFGGIIVLLIISALLYNQNKIRKESHKEINQKNISLRNLLDEKEWLMREIHHRVKNNLQIVMSLLNSQSAYLKDAAAIKAIKDGQHRVHAISLIHQKLYQSENVSVINMHSYITDLLDYMSSNLDVRNNIRFIAQIEPIELEVAQAVPLGLILNEAVTNSIKYAFPGERSGQVTVSMKNVSQETIELIVQDNGIGFVQEADQALTQSLGLSLMQGLCKQLDGAFDMFNNMGTTVRIRFTSVKDVKINPETSHPDWSIRSF